MHDLGQARKTAPQEKKMKNPRLITAGLTSMTALIATCIAFTAPHEGRIYHAYRDIGGTWTICDGYARGVKEGDTATEEDCFRLNGAAHADAIEMVLKLSTTPIPLDSFIAFEDFVYNAGAGNFSKSSMLKKINSGDLLGACWEFNKWVYVKGKDCRIKINNCYGIVKRRLKETAQCLKGVK